MAHLSQRVGPSKVARRQTSPSGSWSFFFPAAPNSSLDLRKSFRRGPHRTPSAAAPAAEGAACGCRQEVSSGSVTPPEPHAPRSYHQPHDPQARAARPVVAGAAVLAILVSGCGRFVEVTPIGRVELPPAAETSVVLGADGRRPRRAPRRAGPRRRAAVAHPAGAPRRGDRRRGHPLLRPRRRRRPRDRPRGAENAHGPRRAGRVDDHPAAGEERDDRRRADPRAQAPRRASRSSSRRSSPRTRSSSSTSTPCTSATAPTACRPPPAATSASTSPARRCPGGAARRAAEGADDLRPARAPETPHAAPRPRPVAHGRAGRVDRRRRRPPPARAPLEVAPPPTPRAHRAPYFVAHVLEQLQHAPQFHVLGAGPRRAGRAHLPRRAAHRDDASTRAGSGPPSRPWRRTLDRR
jgi:hypothetical protein